MGDIVNLPKRPEPLRCESDSPDCGPVIYVDAMGIFMCQRCAESLEIETESEYRTRELGLRVIMGDKDAPK